MKSIKKNDICVTVNDDVVIIVDVFETDLGLTCGHMDAFGNEKCSFRKNLRKANLSEQVLFWKTAYEAKA